MSRKVAHEMLSLFDNYGREEFIERADNEYSCGRATAELCWELINYTKEETK